MSNLIITVTHGRPKALEVLTPLIQRQTTNHFDWLIVSDSYDDYKWPTKPKPHLIKRDTKKDKLPSICENWLAALDWIEGKPQYEHCIICEDDDYYHKEYVVQTLALLEKADLVGWHDDAYYYVLSRKARRCHNIGFAALAATAFNRSAIPYIRECCQEGKSYIDMLLWFGIKATSHMPQPPITLGNGQVISPPPVQYSITAKSFTGTKLLANNFTGIHWGQKATLSYNKEGQLQYTTNQPVINEQGNIDGEYPRHVGMKEPWHAGALGLSESGHDPRQGGGPDLYGDLLRKWIGEDAKRYLHFTKDPPGRDGRPYPPNILVPMLAEKD